MNFDDGKEVLREGEMLSVFQPDTLKSMSARWHVLAFTALPPAVLELRLVSELIGLQMRPTPRLSAA